MAFHNVKLPEDIERGAVGGPMFMTNISTTQSGHEFANAKWAFPRQSWDIGYGIEQLSDPLNSVPIIQNFFYAREGRLHSFLFKDWTDYVVTDQIQGTGTGAANVFQLIKLYTSGAVTYTRKITRPINGSLFVTLNNVPTIAYTVNYSTGVLTFTSPPANGVIVRATFEFDVRVRFDTDQLALAVETYDAVSIPSLPIIEVRE
jgi:uncharacterized protein (TIGR02217 family)